MRAPFTQLYFHLVWATWDRLPLLTNIVRPVAYDALQAECRAVEVDLVAIGGMEDHVHLLVRTPATMAVSRLVQQLKGASSHLINHEVRKDFAFKWQGGYGAFTVSKRAVRQVRAYILDQEEHHRYGTVHAGCEPAPAPPPVVQPNIGAESAKADFVPLLPRVHSPDLCALSPLT